MKATLSAFNLDGSEIYVGFRIDEVDAPTLMIGEKWTLFAPGDVCLWTEDIDGDWHTDCKDIFFDLNGSPTQNKMRFCCYCGRPLKEAKR